MWNAANADKKRANDRQYQKQRMQNVENADKKRANDRQYQRQRMKNVNNADKKRTKDRQYQKQRMQNVENADKKRANDRQYQRMQNVNNADRKRANDKQYQRQRMQNVDKADKKRANDRQYQRQRMQNVNKADKKRVNDRQYQRQRMQNVNNADKKRANDRQYQRQRMQIKEKADYKRSRDREYQKKKMTIQENVTVKKSKTSKWFEARYARITASKIYEAFRCKTPEGSLLECLLGATKIVQNSAMSRGLKLESDVLKVVESSLNLKITNVGIYINKNYPIFGASPDEVTSDLCIEIKCPTKIKTISNYISTNNEIKQKYFARMQMFLTGRDKELFCVACSTFEEDKHVTCIEVFLDKEYCEEMMTNAL
ncbi:uncharacterized protein CBL_20777, partial [Carabus blaptoides fortunei]